MSVERAEFNKFLGQAVGQGLARYALVVVVGWIGLMKFTAYEAEGVSCTSPTAR